MQRKLIINGHKALVSYESEIKAFRGKCLGLTGYCDFVFDDFNELHREAEISLAEYVESCRAEGIEPFIK
ncbi:TPA: type II toxin-antitoxin system HicB family antitoxin [Providencia alcalifaciens]